MTIIHKPITDADLYELLNQPEPPTKMHYYQVTRPTEPALCGKKPSRGSWDKHYQPHKNGGNTRGYETCPACQIRYNLLPAGGGR